MLPIQPITLGPFKYHKCKQHVTEVFLTANISFSV